MKYYKICNCEHAVKNPMICDSNLKELQIDEERFDLCEKYDNTKNQIEFYPRDAEDDGSPDDALQNMHMIPVFSPRLIEALKDAGIQGIQYVPIDIYNFKREKIEGFCIANIIDFVENAYVHQKSRYVTHPQDYKHINMRGKIWFVLSYVVKSEKLVGHDIFRLKNDDKFEQPFSKILVSEKFKSVFTKNKFTGYAFSSIVTE